jgi:hypothetical protein
LEKKYIFIVACWHPFLLLALTPLPTIQQTCLLLTGYTMAADTPAALAEVAEIVYLLKRYQPLIQHLLPLAGG